MDIPYNPNQLEIERKYIVEELPSWVAEYPCSLIEQGYLCTMPTVRVRCMDDRYILTVKERLAVPIHNRGEEFALDAPLGSAIHNREEEFALSAEAYARLRAKCEGRLISKHRYRIDLAQQTGDEAYRGLTAELDRFHGDYEGLLLVEVEFPTTEASERFRPPRWFGREVSGDRRYSNASMSAAEGRWR